MSFYVSSILFCFVYGTMSIEILTIKYDNIILYVHMVGLPDDASKEAASMVDNDNTVVIDASTAFRVDDDWTYGFPGTIYYSICIVSMLSNISYLYLMQNIISYTLPMHTQNYANHKRGHSKKVSAYPILDVIPLVLLH